MSEKRYSIIHHINCIFNDGHDWSRNKFLIEDQCERCGETREIGEASLLSAVLVVIAGIVLTLYRLLNDLPMRRHRDEDP